ncbi:uncharacterized protein LOC143082126 [Mytilus galloprovincialis]|uniref:uncharacterized protein LOC143082126 n=1 Tax=Mytilus galloprovincialis TaxID=29158 RepID=UPI003F7B8C1B
MSTTEKPSWGLNNSTRSILPTTSVESPYVTSLVSTTEKPYWGSDNSTLPTGNVASLNVTDLLATTDKPYLKWGSSSTLITGKEGLQNVTDLISSTKKPYFGWGNSSGENSNESSSSCSSSINLVGPILGVLLVLVSIIFIVIILRLRKTGLRKHHRNTKDTIRTYEDIGSIPADHIYTAMQQSSGRDSYIQPRSPYINHHTNTLIGKIEEHEFTEGESEDNQYSQMQDQHHYVDIIA